VSRRLLDQGAKAIVLTGSHARVTARPHSDIDLFAIGDGPNPRLEWVDDRFVGVYWFTPDEVRQRMTHPASALFAVWGWRDGLIVDDPHGIAAELQREAHDWTWDKIGAEADAWVAERLEVYAEYAQKLVGALDNERELDACALRSQLALGLADVCAVRHRLTAESENGFWETVADADGADWRAAQERAFAKNGESVADSAAGALTMFALLAEGSGRLLDDRQRVVVENALKTSARWR